MKSFSKREMLNSIEEFIIRKHFQEKVEKKFGKKVKSTSKVKI